MIQLLRLAALAAIIAVGTFTLGWYAVPLAAAVFTLLTRGARAPSEAAMAAFGAWLVLLLRMQRFPSFGTLLDQLGQIFPVPGFVVALLTLLLAAVLAATAARVTLGIVGIRETPTRP